MEHHLHVVTGAFGHAGLMENRLVTASSPAGHTALSAWVRDQRETLGRVYACELARRRDRTRSYDALRKP